MYTEGVVNLRHTFNFPSHSSNLVLALEIVYCPLTKWENLMANVVGYHKTELFDHTHTADYLTGTTAEEDL